MPMDGLEVCLRGCLWARPGIRLMVEAVVIHNMNLAIYKNNSTQKIRL